MTTKIVALTDALGNLVRFVLLPGQRFDTVGFPPLVDSIFFEALIADKAFDSNAIIADLDARGAKVVIAQHPRRIPPLVIDREMYKWRMPEWLLEPVSARSSSCRALMRCAHITLCSPGRGRRRVLRRLRSVISGRNTIPS